MGVTRLFAIAISILCLLSGTIAQAQSGKSNAELNQLVDVQQCTGALTESIQGSLAHTPKFNDLEEGVRWVRTHLPTGFQNALGKAGSDTLIIAGPEGLSKLAASKKFLYRVLLATTFRNLFDVKRWRNSPCADGIPWVLEDSLTDFSEKRFAGTKALVELNELGDDFPRMNGRILLLLLTLDATGQKWEVSWLSQAMSAQKEMEAAGNVGREQNRSDH